MGPSSYTPSDLPQAYNSAILAPHPRLGLARLIPQDGRIQLAFDFHWQAQQDEMDYIRQIGLSSTSRDDYLHHKAKLGLESLGSFFEPDFETFGTFIIRDTHPSNPGADLHYNIGDRSPYVGVPVDNRRFDDGQELSQWLDRTNFFSQNEPQPKAIAPWQRVILCQGLSFASVAEQPQRSLPFLVHDVESDPIRMATDIHLSGERRGGSEATNPYSNPHNAFHITFYERLQNQTSGLLEASHRRRLRIGRLYAKPQENNDMNGKENDAELAFRQSSFTMIATTRHTKVVRQTASPSNPEYYWTILILSPSNFFPLRRHNLGTDWKISGGQMSQQTAELSYIVYALREVEERWRQFNKHIETLLVEDFMDPEAYTKLLFDDQTFSRSRLYFWIIGCLNEFDVSIDDNIKQCTLYRQARVHPRLDSILKSSSKSSGSDSSGERDLFRLQELDKEAGEIQQSLKDLQAQFKAKLATVQALRDGLFNASALMESRSSTRLGQDVQLLTYVSIFYLPLAFCAALWAIPNITDGDTRNPFIVTALLVGFVTYAIVFNLGNIAQVLGRKYFSRKRQLLQKMEEDHDLSWQKRRERFEEFPPNEERKRPSEWWIVGYQIYRWFRKLGVKAASSSGAVTA
ncbi:hypothetical protein BDW66DRAFT_155736 [Aspergillus desertorum]